MKVPMTIFDDDDKTNKRTDYPVQPLYSLYTYFYTLSL